MYQGTTALRLVGFIPNPAHLAIASGNQMDIMEIQSGVHASVL
jgi:hypothetical protein